MKRIKIKAWAVVDNNKSFILRNNRAYCIYNNRTDAINTKKERVLLCNNNFCKVIPCVITLGGGKK